MCNFMTQLLINIIQLERMHFIEIPLQGQLCGLHNLPCIQRIGENLQIPELLDEKQEQIQCPFCRT